MVQDYLDNAYRELPFSFPECPDTIVMRHATLESFTAHDPAPARQLVAIGDRMRRHDEPRK
jgi:hypothetical protein